VEQEVDKFAGWVNTGYNPCAVTFIIFFIIAVVDASYIGGPQLLSHNDVADLIRVKRRLSLS